MGHVVSRLGQTGKRPAAFIAETLPSVGGPHHRHIRPRAPSFLLFRHDERIKVPVANGGRDSQELVTRRAKSPSPPTG